MKKKIKYYLNRTQCDGCGRWYLRRKGLCYVKSELLCASCRNRIPLYRALEKYYLVKPNGISGARINLPKSLLGKIVKLKLVR